METDLRSALATALGASVTAVKEGALEAGDALPAVTFNRVSTSRLQALGSGSPVIGSRPWFQVELWAATPTERDTVLPTLVSGLCGLPHAVRLVNQRSFEDAETGWFCCRLDVRVCHAGA